MFIQTHFPQSQFSAPAAFPWGSELQHAYVPIMRMKQQQLSRKNKKMKDGEERD